MATVVSNGVKTVQFTSGGTKIKMYLALTNYPRGNTNYIWAQMYIDSSTGVGSYDFLSNDKKPVTVTVNGVSHTINCMWAIAGSSTRDWHINASASYNGASGTGCLITKNNKWEQWFAVDNNADGSAKTVNWSWSFGKSNTSGSSGGSTITDSGTWTTTATQYVVTCKPNGGSGSDKTVKIGLDNSGTLPAAITRSNSSETVTGYKVSFNKNNGATTPNPITSTRTKTTPWNFGGWNTNTSGTGTNYSAGGSYSKGYNQNILTATNHYNGTSDAYNAHNTTGFVGNSGGNGTLGSRTTDKPTSGDGYSNITTVFTVTSNTSGNRDFAQKNIPFISGQKYTLSWWEKGSGNNLIRSWNSTDDKEVLWQKTSMPSTWTRKTYTFTATSEMWEDNCSACVGCTGSATGAWAGIKLEKGSTATAYTPNYNDTSGVTLYAKWTAGTVTYTNNAITLPAAITRADSSANTTLTTSFNVNGGSSAAPAPLTSTKTVVTKHDFNGWHEGSASGTSHGASTSFTPSAAITMYAGWNSSTKSTTYTNITLPAAPTRTGYTFAGWYTASSGGTRRGGAGDSYQPTANGTLYAHWTPITYTISWNLDGGTLPNGTNYIYDSGNYTYIQCPTSMPYDNSAYTVNEGKSRNSYFSVGTPTKVGYTFTGWVVTGMDSTTHYFWYDGAGQSTTATTFDTRTISTKCPPAQHLRATAGTVTWTAQWTPATYTITFNPNGGTVSSTTKTVTYGTAYTDLPKATRPGYKFKGWFANCANVASTAINFGAAYMYVSTLNVHFVTYSADYSDWGSYRMISCTQSGGWNIEDNGSGTPRFAVYDETANAYKHCVFTKKWADLTPGFHQWDIILSSKVITVYIDNAKEGTLTLSGNNIKYNTATSIFVGGEAGANATNAVSPYLNGYIGNLVISNSATRITDLGRQRFIAPAQNVTLYAMWEPYFNVYIKGKSSGWVLLKDGHNWQN